MTGLDFPSAAAALAGRVLEAAARPLGEVCRLEVAVPPIPAFDWLQAQGDPIRGYWADRDGRESIAAIGEAIRLKGEPGASPAELFDRVGRLLSDAGPQVRLFGGFRFAPARPPGTVWGPFGAYRFILPAIELRVADGQGTLAVNLRPENREAAPRIAATLREMPVGGGPARELPRPWARRDDPDVTRWAEMLDAALAGIRAGDLRKVVLARRSGFLFGKPLDPMAVFARMLEGAPGCFHFLGSHTGERAFFGASPERLYRRVGRRLETEALAGTRPRGTDAVADARLAAELHASAKDRQEHAVVVDFIRSALERLGAAPDLAAAPSILQLARVQHLRTGIAAELPSSVTDADLIAALHPTPAVAGYPRETALKTIEKLEPFDRGWYAGPVGWVARDAAEFAVALRCGLVADRRLGLFAGAGIVEGSDPDREWQEIEAKMSSLAGLFPSTIPPLTINH